LNFTNKIVVITGSGRGIGRAIALHFARLGADIVVNFFRNRQPAEDTARDIEALGRRALVVKADVGEADGIEKLIDETVKGLGGLDYLICNAASGYNRPVMQQKIKGWDWTLNINARSVLFLAQKAAPVMQARGGGAIVSISSLGSKRVLPEYVVVGVSKAALEAVTRYLAVELAPMNIVVNAVSGGVVDTDALRHFRATQDNNVLVTAADRTPAGRIVEPEDVANVVAFLCTPQAEMIRGQTIVVDGGYTLLI
jgi:enoyl-[acyl-carrier protein] reductase III